MSSLKRTATYCVRVLFSQGFSSEETSGVTVRHARGSGARRGSEPEVF